MCRQPIGHRPEIAGDAGQRAGIELEKLQAPRILARHEDAVGGGAAEAEAPVIAEVPHQQHDAMAERVGLAQALAHQPVADLLLAPVGGYADGAQQQGGHGPGLGQDSDRPIAHGADQPPVVSGDQAEGRDRAGLPAIAVGLLLVPVGAEGFVEQGLDGGAVAGPFAFDGDRHGRVLEQETTAWPSAEPSGRWSGRRDASVRRRERRGMDPLSRLVVGVEALSSISALSLKASEN
jgi:hypothetical protein